MAKINDDTVLGINIPAIEERIFSLKIIGDTPLICHNWGIKAVQMIIDKQQKKATNGREVRDPFGEFCDSLYWLSERPENATMDDILKGRFGFKTAAFKAAAIDAGYQQGILTKKTTVRGAFYILGEYTEIVGTPEFRQDMVRIGMGIADIRYRSEFKTWSTTLHIRYNPRAISNEQIVNLMNYGGFAVGVGEWRPQKDGNYGTFHVANEGE